MTFRYANAESVAVAWLNNLFGAGMAGPQLPSDNTTWAASGFVQVTVFGGHSSPDVPAHHPVIGISCWANDPNTGRPPYGKAFNLASTIVAATYHEDQPWLTIPFCDERARVSTTYVFEEPRRNYGDTGDYACVSMNMTMNWTTI